MVRAMWRAPVRALALTLFDRGGGAREAYEARIDWAIADLAEFLAYAGPRTTFALTVTAWVIELAPIFIVKKLSRMSRLEPADRLAYLEAVDQTRLAIMLILPKALLSLVYFE